MLEKHLKVFQRDAFRTPCVRELPPSFFIEAIDDTQAALNTGSLYSRNKNFLGEFPSYDEYKTEEFKNGFEKIISHLRDVKSFLYNYQNLYESEDKGFYCFKYSDTLFMLINMVYNGDLDLIEKAVKLLDSIDSTRNEIIKIINELLGSSVKKLPIIALSSELIKNIYFKRDSVVTKFLEHQLPQEFQNIDKDKEYIWAYQRFEEYVINNYDSILKSLDEQKIPLESMYDRVFWVYGFYEHKARCIQWEKEGKIPKWTEKGSR